MYECDVECLKKWLRVSMIYMTANTSEEYHELLYSFWPIYQDAVKNECGPVLKALKQELAEWIKGLEETQREELQKRLTNLHLEPEANTSDKDLGKLLEAKRLERQSLCQSLDGDLQPEGQGRLCSA